ncbi:MAG: hypothetical protein ABFS42_06830 [Candidatus Krumholzibacteriota bacterium]
MKKLVLIFVVSLMASSAFAGLDPNNDMMGIYFSPSGENYCLMAPINTPFDLYLILANPTSPSINAYELGLDVEVPAGMEGMVFRLASNIADNVVSGVDVGTNGPLGGDFIVGLASPLPAQEALILHSWQYMLLGTFRMDMFIGASSQPSIPGDLPVVQNAEGSILMQVHVTPSWDGNGSAAIINQCPPSAVEDASFGSVKSLYR